MKVEIVGAVGGLPTISPQAVAQVFSCPVSLGPGSPFPGKVSTRLYADARHVLKLKSGFSLSRDSAVKWCVLQLQRESGFGIYPPHRHWVVLEGEEGYAVANISRRAVTLEQMLASVDAALDVEHVACLFSGLFQCYFGFWRAQQLRQDEGLSNYIVEDGRIYYIDDDIYRPDNLVSLAHSLCAWLRRPDFLDMDRVAAMATALRQEISRTDILLLAVLSEQLRDVFLPLARAPLRHCLLDHLVSGEVASAVSCAERIAVLADIHGNLPALQAVLADMQAAGLQQALVLGDVVGYGPFPAECVDLLRVRPWLFVRGNHDQAAAEGEARSGFSRAARWSLPWTVARLEARQRSWLGTLPLLWRDDRYMAVHGAPVDPTFFNGYVYAATAEHNLDCLQAKNVHVCFHGHSHLRGFYRRNSLGLDDFSRETVLELEENSHYLVCPGSVGQPRDGSQLAQYLIFDRRQQRLEFREVPYDRERLRTALREAELPDFITKLFDCAD